MKYLKYLFLLLLTLTLVTPFAVNAEGEEENQETTEETTESTEDDKEVTVYFFRGEGCSHCAEAEAWFESIEEEYGSKYKIVDYETWYEEKNAELMQKVAKVRKEEESATGVPYIIIGNQSWIGFAENNKQEIIDKINEMYDQDPKERYDVMNFVDDVTTDDKEEKKSSSDVVSLLLILVVVAGIGSGIYFARKNTNKKK